MLYRKFSGTQTWHFCTSCSAWPATDFVEQDKPPAVGDLCNECRAIRKADAGSLERTREVPNGHTPAGNSRNE